MERWSGRTALVTGASSGIGAALVKELAKHGMNVLACARDEPKLKVPGTVLIITITSPTESLNVPST